MSKKERWFSSAVLLVSVLPLLFIGIIQGIVDGPFVFIDKVKGVEYKLTNYQMDFIGLFCLVPALILIVSRFIRNKGMIARHFPVIVIAVLTLCIVYFIAIIVVASNTLSTLTIVDVVFKINYVSFICTGLCLVFCVLGNFLPDLPPNPIFGIKNRYTTSSKAVWEKVNATASNAVMYIFLIDAIITAFSSNISAVIFLIIGILLYYGWAYLYSYYINKKFNKK